MNIEVNEVEYCKLEVNYTADAGVVKSKMDEIVNDFRDVKIPGFRRGKAPLSAIKIKLKDRINMFVVEHMKAQAYDDIVFKTETKPIGYPKFEETKLDGDNFSCKLTFIKKPDFELKNYQYEFKKIADNYDVESEINSTINDLTLKLGETQIYQDGEFVERGDQITIDFVGSVDGSELSDATENGYLYVVGQNKFPEFDDNLLGMLPGEFREFDVTFPDGFYDLTGKTVHFKVTFHMGVKKIPCNVDDEFAKQCGYETVAVLKENLQKIVEAKFSQSRLLQTRTELLNRLVDDNDFKTPDQINILEAQFLAMKNGIDWESLNSEEKNILQERAQKQVKLSFILDSVRDLEPESVLSDMEAQNGLLKRAELQGLDPALFFAEAQKNGSLLGLLTSLKDEFTIQWLVNKVTFVD